MYNLADKHHEVYNLAEDGHQGIYRQLTLKAYTVL